MIARFVSSHRLSLIALIFLGFLSCLDAQQLSDRVVHVEQAAQINDAVMISSVAVSGKALECGLFVRPPAVVQPVSPFQAGGDWLKDMTISMVNRTNKVIVFGSLIMHFLDTGDCRSTPCAAASIDFGHKPPIDAFDGRTGQPLKSENPERPALNWKPEQQLTIHADDFLPQIEKQLADFMSVKNVTKVNIYRGMFYFSDGTRWNLGRYSDPDLQHPGKFKDLPIDYFPGRRGNNWPPGYEQ